MSTARWNLKGRILSRRTEPRLVLTAEGLYRAQAALLKEYPVILSTTYSIRQALVGEHLYDYLLVSNRFLRLCTNPHPRRGGGLCRPSRAMPVRMFYLFTTRLHLSQGHLHQ
jgi:hypothetical protein